MSSELSAPSDNRPTNSRRVDSPADSPNPSDDKRVSSKQPPGDFRLLKADLRAATAYADALTEAGTLTNAEHDDILTGLRQIETDYDQGRFTSPETDVFAAIQQQLM